MYLSTSCIECSTKLPPGTPTIPLSWGALRDDGLIFAECDEGHQLCTIVQNDRFELLFEVAIFALLDGYFREAVTSASAAFERFMEFYVRHHWIGNGINSEEVERTWHAMHKQSERQLGAFLAAYLSDHGRAYKPDEVRASFRNKVVHKGAFPSRTDAADYLRWVHDSIVRIGSELKHAHDHSVTHEVISHAMDRAKAAAAKAGREVTGSVVHGLVLAWNVDGWEESDFDSCVSSARDHRPTSLRISAEIPSTLFVRVLPPPGETDGGAQ